MNNILVYTFLLAAVFFGTTSNIFAKNSEGFTKIFPSFISALTIILCMYCLAQSMKILPVGITYASFAGLCIIATTIIGFLKFNQIPNLYAFLGLILIIFGVILTNVLGEN